MIQMIMALLRCASSDFTNWLDSLVVARVWSKVDGVRCIIWDKQLYKDESQAGRGNEIFRQFCCLYICCVIYKMSNLPPYILWTLEFIAHFKILHYLLAFFDTPVWLALLCGSTCFRTYTSFLLSYCLPLSKWEMARRQNRDNTAKSFEKLNLDLGTIKHFERRYQKGSSGTQKQGWTLSLLLWFGAGQWQQT